MVKTLQYPLPEEGYLKQLIEIKEDNLHCRMGTVFLTKGSRLPEKGLKANPEHEVSILMEGSIKAITNEGERIIMKGEIVQFSPNEMQAGEALEDCTLIWFLINN